MAFRQHSEEIVGARTCDNEGERRPTHKTQRSSTMAFFGRMMARKGNERVVTSSSSPHHQEGSPFEGASVESLLLFTDTLLDLVNHKELTLSLVRRMTLIESIKQTKRDGLCDRQVLTEILFEGILHSPTLDEETKDVLLRVGLMEHRWDLVFERLRLSNCGAWESLGDGEFSNYRRMILRLIRTSRKFQAIPESARNRLKGMILKTETHDQLNDLILRVMERTGGYEVKEKIMNDIVGLRYYRLLWADRLDCKDEFPWEQDRKMAAASRNFNSSDVLYGRVLLPGELDSIDCCPICLDPVHAPALELKCQHIYCSKCIVEWIGASGENSKGQNGGWHCPLCRNEFKGGSA